MTPKIPGYEIVRELGEGGMCVVYLARHSVLGSTVAIKVLHEQFCRKEEMRQRFINEARIMHGLDHENIVKVRDFIEFGGRVALIMDYIEGKTLDHVIGRETGPMPHGKALPLFRQIAEAVGYAHERGVIHRDLKPSNVIVTRDGRAVVTDFGIAKIAGEKGLTRTGAHLGTPYYESPEQIQGARDVDRRSDIYSLGMTLYEMLAGRLPFDEDADTSDFRIAQRIVYEEYEPPSDYYPHIPDHLVEVVQRATAKSPDSRFQSCGELLQTLDPQLVPEAGATEKPAIIRQDLPVADRPPDPVAQSAPREVTPRSQRPSRESFWSRRKGLLIPLMVLIPLLATGAVLITGGSSGESPSSDDSSSGHEFSVEGAVISDLDTGLQWRVGPDRDTDWYEARDWVNGLGGGWRMPTCSELRGLYNAGITSDDWGPFENSGYWVWTGEERDSSSAWLFYFNYGNEYWYARGFSGYTRAFAVRSR